MQDRVEKKGTRLECKNDSIECQFRISKLSSLPQMDNIFFLQKILSSVLSINLENLLRDLA